MDFSADLWGGAIQCDFGGIHSCEARIVVAETQLLIFFLDRHFD
jgi:hypothetical protein